MNKTKRALNIVIKFLREELSHGNVQATGFCIQVIDFLKEYEEWITDDSDESSEQLITALEAIKHMAGAALKLEDK